MANVVMNLSDLDFLLWESSISARTLAAAESS